ncbi:ribonuclease H-like domain-containing protein [Priestia megaterium]|uniref:ribonuclease H-like domain-containing protein n=1 Tax=Priestia megaterium TaxID=1404 RepID=UPI001EDA2B8B|nr:ribonuclease H-like domain-containing protein [Priestia megaterium]UKJ82084.1 ribonuclease H-like domain-containing protein [Priestia megaterium]
MSFKNKLNRMKKHLHVTEAKPPVESNPQQPKSASIPYKQEWKGNHAVPYFAEDSYCMIREVVYPLDYKHGHYEFNELKKVVEVWNGSTVAHPLSSKGRTYSDLFFFDTETTGLSTGTGTTIFLLGYARVLKDSVVFRQHILTEPSGEVAFYESFLKEVDYTTLVTYNGKSFDWPHVKTRHTLLRDHLPKLPKFGHFDLLHASRRLWKHKMNSVKLANVEKEILGIERVDDIPGFLAPMIYFDFIETKNPRGLFDIMKHNEHDILSLITLYIHLSKHLLTSEEFTEKETYEVARWYEQLGENKHAFSLYQGVAEKEKEEHEKAQLAMAYHYKKEKSWKEAVDMFEPLVQTCKGDVAIEALVELAKICEHRLKDVHQALLYTELALEKWNQLRERTKKTSKEALEKRLLRLKNKSAKA